MPVSHIAPLALQASGVGAIPGGYGWSLLKVLLALGLICLLAYLLVRALRGRVGIAGAAGGRGFLKVLDRCPLSPRQDLWLVRAGERVFLLGAGEGGIRRLAELDPDELPPLDQAGARGTSFEQVLERLRGKKGAEQ